MKTYFLRFILYCMVFVIVLPCAASSFSGSTFRFWDRLSATDLVMDSVESKVCLLHTDILNDFSAVFTSIADIATQYTSLVGDAQSHFSQLDTFDDRLQSIESKIDIIDNKVFSLSNQLAILHVNDFGGTWTAIEKVKTTVNSSLMTLLNDFATIELTIDAISGEQLAGFLGTCTTLLSLSDQVMHNMEFLCDIVADSLSDIDRIESCLDIIVDISDTIGSAIDTISSTVLYNFNGTYTALAQLKNKASIIDNTMNSLNSLSLSITAFPSITARFNSIESRVDRIDSAVDDIVIAEQTIQSLLDVMSFDLMTIDSKVDRALSLTDTLISSVRIIDNFGTTIQSKIDLINLSKTTVFSKLSVLDSNIDVSVLLLTTVESTIDVDNLLIQTVASSVDVLRSKVDIGLAITNTVDSKVVLIETMCRTINSAIDLFVTTESRIDQLCGTIASSISKSATIDSKIDVLNTLFLNDVNKIRTIESTVDTVILKTYTMNSTVDVLKSDVSTINSTLDVITRGLISVESKVCMLESTVDHMDSKVDHINTAINTVNSNLDILAVNFIYTWTIMQAMNNKTETISSQMITIQSKVDVLKNTSVGVDLSGTYTALKKIEHTLSSVDSVLDSIALQVPDVSGTFTALQFLVDKSCTMLESLEDADSGLLTIGTSDCAGTNITAAMIGTAGYTISSPGRYSLDTHINFVPVAAATAITINASNVEFDLCQKTLLHTPATAFTVIGIEVSGTVENITIKNGAVRQMDGDNIRIGDGATRVTIHNMRVINAESNGINCIGIVNNLTVTQSLIQASGSAGLRIQRGIDILIHDNLITGNTGGGIVIDPGSGTVEQVTISNCLLSQNSSHGINIDGTTGTRTNIIIDSCASLINTGAGIRASKVTNSIFKNNMIVSNTINGIHLVDAVDSLEIYNNVMNVNTGVGLFVDDTNALPCSFHSNIMSLNTVNNYQEDASAGSHSVLSNYARAVAEANNYSIGGGTGPTTINKSIIDQGTGTFGTRPEKWRNISMTT